MNIVFLGDSITDAGRNLDNGSMLSIGQGYPMIVCAKLSAEHPNHHTFLNTGVSGSRIVDLYARIKTDVWNHAPDVMSILVGVNDVWHELSDAPNGVEADRFENVYRMLLADTRKRFPNVKFLLLEPFVLRASSTEANWDVFCHEISARSAALQKLAEEFGAMFVPLQSVLDDACKCADAPYWLADGVHPTPAGHHLIANAWLKAFDALV